MAGVRVRKRRDDRAAVIDCLYQHGLQETPERRDRLPSRIQFDDPECGR
jgi:hypothetical protein